jgi:ribosome modulation factor
MKTITSTEFQAELDAMVERAEGQAAGFSCPECGCRKGHRIDCKTGNEKARGYQAGLTAKHREKRKPMFTVEQAAAWMERHCLDCSTATARAAMEDAATLLTNKLDAFSEKRV